MGCTTMCCEQVERQLGCYVDGELPPDKRREFESHLEECVRCRDKLGELEELAAALADSNRVDVPSEIWSGIESRLDAGRVGSSGPERRWAPVLRARWSLAAAVVLVVGLGIVGIASLETRVRASSIDFRALLRALPLDAHKAFTEFLVRYDAKVTTASSAEASAKHLNFATPEMLPGGFELRSVYELRMGRHRGIAASYDRNGEFLAVVFHPPMRHENFGSHEDLPCVIGKHCGHKVQVGEWTLVHLTDPTTCHCLLSRLDEQTEIPAVMAAIAPKLTETGTIDDHHHP